MKNFPRPIAARIIERFSPAGSGIQEIDFASGTAGDEASERLRAQLQEFFHQHDGFPAIRKLNYLDGVRISFANGDVVHIRPSGNADELRAYAVADTPPRADQIIALAVAEPDGILRLLERSVLQ